MSESEKNLEILRRPFPSHQISKLPKPTKSQTEAIKLDPKKGIRCKECGGWHHPDVVHLDYVGHAALTDRLLDCDLNWTWEPLAFDEVGLPKFDNNGGLWIKLTVCGLTRLGYGNAIGSANKDPGSREKEVIGDALRNAAMRFGAALDLWHKGDLHKEEDDDAEKASGRPQNSIQTAIERKKVLPEETKIKQVQSHDDFVVNKSENVTTKMTKEVRSVPVAEIVKLTTYVKSKGRTEAWLAATVKSLFGLVKLTDLTVEQIEKIKSHA